MKIYFQRSWSLILQEMDVCERLEYLRRLDNNSIVSLFNLLLERLVVFSDDRQADTIIRSI